MNDKTDRRQFLTKGVLTAAGIAAAGSIPEQNVSAATATTEAAPKVERPKAGIAPGSLPCGKIGNVSLSRLILGGNLIGFCSHSRDLIYVHKLFRAYNTEAKIFETLDIAQQCGVNTILTDSPAWLPVLKYNRRRTQKIQMMVAVGIIDDRAKMNAEIKRLVGEGATLLYCHGCSADEHTMQGKIDAIGQALELMKAQGVPAGVGGHSLETPLACEKHHLDPDFYVKTFHMDRYWSATPKANREDWCWYTSWTGEDHDKFYDNMWCLDADKVTEFMAPLAKPWVAFKVMAAGAIHPRMAFAHAYHHGADFIVAGMFDFQIEDDVKIAVEAVRTARSRTRPWHG